MKKILLGLGLSMLTLFSLFGVVSAKVARVPGPWSLTAPKPIILTCGGTEYAHHLNSVVNNTENGDFYGEGTYDADASYTWGMTGNITGDAITFQIVYTGTDAGYTLNGSGTIASDGSIQGSLANGCESFSMPVKSAVRFTDNHGQWVKKGKGDLEAAHSRIGMPVVTWALRAPKSIAFTCDGLVYTHTLNSVENDLETGDFTGTGTYNKDTSYGWDIVGKITGNNMTYQLVYNGTDAGYTLNGVGTIAINGSVTGTTDGNCQTFTMKPGSLVRNNGLKSSIVNAGRVKKLSTKVKTGIPVQSRDNNTINGSNNNSSNNNNGDNNVILDWTLKAPKPVTFTCGGLDYKHTLNSVENNLETGNFTGTGTYNKDKSYGWNIVGNITDDSITYQLVYTGTDAGYTLNGVGIIASDGSISGTTDGNCQTFTMGAKSLVKKDELKSSVVKAGKVKKLSTKVKTGIPVQSRDNEIIAKTKKTK